MNAKPRVVSTFAGCGGLDLGFELENFRTVWANDFSEFACDTYRHNIGDHIVHGDITKIDPFNDKSIPDADVVTGGFPCQDFSVIWKRPGLDGERGGLYKNFRDFVAAKQPKVFVAENVKGLLTANKKMAIKTIVEDLESLEPGYIVKPRLYNFAEYGVPQFRERVLIVGIRLDTGFNFKHPKPTHGPRGDQPYLTAGKALEGVESAKFNNELMRQMPRTRKIIEMIPEGGNFTDIPKDHEFYVKGMISHVYRRIHRNEPAKTIIAAGGGGTWGYHYPEPRALTNRERARLQSFPDWFEFLGSTTEVRRQIGNAVPPEGVRPLAKRIHTLFKGDYEPVDLSKEKTHLESLSIAERLRLSEEEVN
ncbi:DNA cytosine methyltransferase [Corynebacterium sp. H128]|uniref:DNA cytosine methyltransferase n=1 Tax=Corynebacterium sp. H128 TaxID=3133427 RepID=UPI003095C6BD